MTTYVLNQEFNSKEEFDAWEEKNIPDRVFNNQNVLMVNLVENIKTGKITLREIVCI